MNLPGTALSSAPSGPAPAVALESRERDCFLCGGRACRRLMRKSGYQLVVCRRCGLVYQNPCISDHARRQGWNQVRLDGTSFLEHYQAGEAWRRELARRRLDRLAGLGYAKGRLLDVGCASGIFLDEARRRGFQVAGVDSSPLLVDFGRRTYGLDIWEGDFLEVDGLQPGWSVITVFDTFCYQSRPRDFLDKAYRLLRPGGMLWLTASYANIGLCLFHEPVPFNFYVTPRTMDRFLGETGFERFQSRVIVKDANLADHHGFKGRLFGVPLINSLFKKMVESFAWRGQARFQATAE